MELAKELIADIRRFDEQLKSNTARMTALLDEHGTRLREIDGVGPVLAARLLGRTGTPSRFASEAAYANYTGTAPVQIASAETNRHRLSRYGDRQLNSAIHTIAMIQIRMPTSAGRTYYDKKIAEGKSPRSATRASNDTSPATSGASCSPTKPVPPEHFRHKPQTPLDK